MMNQPGLTIGRLARAANVGIETIRYYQRRELLLTPDNGESTFRIYPSETIDRIQFIKRAQELGFSLDEIATFLRFEDGVDRKAIRKVATDRLGEIRSKIEDLQGMERVLSRLVSECEATGRAKPCPVIAALSGKRKKPSESS
jgi:Hg(II)-responsive transcriptional regulator